MARIHRNITSSPPSTWPRRRLAVSIAGGGGGVALGLMGAGSGGVVESGCCCGGRGGSLSSATSGQEAARGWRRAERRGEERRGVERCRRRKVAEGRRGGDAGVNTPVISVKCTWAQLARRYYCSYAEPYGLEISGDFAFFFWKCSAKAEMNGRVWRGDCVLLYYWKGLFWFGGWKCHRRSLHNCWIEFCKGYFRKLL